MSQTNSAHVENNYTWMTTVSNLCCSVSDAQGLN